MREEKILKNATLCFPIDGDKLLFGKKTRHIGMDRWNGYGGGIEDGETPLQSMLRELEEEANIKAHPAALEKVAIMDFCNALTDGNFFVCRVHIYLLHKWEGEFQPTEEMASPTWFEQQNLPLDGMMPADREWLPIVLKGKKLIGKAKYSPFQESLLGEVEFRFVDSFSDD